MRFSSKSFRNSVGCSTSYSLQCQYFDFSYCVQNRVNKYTSWNAKIRRSIVFQINGLNQWFKDHRMYQCLKQCLFQNIQQR